MFDDTETGQDRAIDAGRSADWGRTSEDYAQFRPDPPDSLFHKLQVHGVGLPGQRILDLGTGTGALARRFAMQGCSAAGADIADGQIDAARRLAADAGLNIAFEVAPAECIPFASNQFDVVTANQCWIYFDAVRTTPELLRVLVPGGLVSISHFSYMPRLDPIARASEDLVMQYNPDWTGVDWDGVIPADPGWLLGKADLRVMFYYEEPVAFTKESWRGRMRALRGIGASLTPEEVAAFDAHHADLLDRIITVEPFTVIHRIHAHIYQMRVDA